MKDMLKSLLFAFSFLTIIPLPFLRKTAFTDNDISRSPAFFPLIGLMYGLLLYACVGICSWIIVPDDMTALMILAIPYCLSGFLHFDGLCDVMDAFPSGNTPARRLRILKDSSIGSFAVGGAVIFMLLKLLLLVRFVAKIELVSYLIIIPVFSRYGMVLLAYASSYPRKKGAGFHIIGRISRATMAASTALLMSVCAIFVAVHGAGMPVVIPLAASAAAGLLFLILFRIYSYKKIGGVTGDVLGASNEVMEVLIIIILFFAR